MFVHSSIKKQAPVFSLPDLANNKSNKTYRIRNITTTKCMMNNQISLNFPIGKIGKKNVALSGIFFSNLMIYTIVRNMKDVLFIHDCGAQYIPVVKTWINFPISLLFVWIYNQLLNRFLHDWHTVYRITYCIVLFTITLLGLLYPVRYYLMWEGGCDIVLLRNWITTIYYTMSPIWGTVVVSVLFWTLANRITSRDDAKHVYPLMGIFANTALVIAGFIMQVSGYYFANNWNHNVLFLTFINFLFGSISLGLHEWFIANDVNHNTTTFYVESSTTTTTKPSMLDSLQEIGKSAFIRNMVIMITCYGIVVNFYEMFWKHYIKQYFNDPVLHSIFMAKVSSCKGLITMMMMFTSSFVLSRVSWKTCALITPIIMLILGLFFFIIIGGSSTHTSSAFFVVITGAVLSIFSKSSKYSLFDPCKEIAYISEDFDTQTKGKSVVDVLSTPIGKSGSSLIQQGVLMYTHHSIINASRYIGCLYVIACCSWIFSVIDLYNRHINTDGFEKK